MLTVVRVVDSVQIGQQSVVAVKWLGDWGVSQLLVVVGFRWIGVKTHPTVVCWEDILMCGIVLFWNIYVWVYSVGIVFGNVCECDV